MSNLVEHAKIELEAIGAFDEDSDYAGEAGKAVLELVKVFAEQEHSGMSASLVRALFNKVADFKPLSPITGKDGEWADCRKMGEKEVYQNKRCSAIFKDGKNGTPHYISAITFRGQNGSCFSGGDVKLKNGSSIGSSQNIKLPFVPKTFVIDVIETEWADKDEKVKKQGGGWWTSVIKDEKQLDAVWEYYEKPKEK